MPSITLWLELTSLLTLLSVITMLARTVTVTEMLLACTSVATRFRPLVTGDRKVHKRTDYSCSTSPGGIQVVDLYFPVGGMTTKMIE
jgi:hypothetical protein